MTHALILKGILIGLLTAMPVGPIGILVIAKTIEGGRLKGFLVGLGDATALLIYGFIATAGLGITIKKTIGDAYLLTLMGSIFLIYLGYDAFTKISSESPRHTSSTDLLKGYLSTLFLALSSPPTIFVLAGILAGFKLEPSLDTLYFSSLLVGLSIFVGAGIWWLLVSHVVHFFKERLTIRVFTLINKGSGLLIIGFGLSSILSLVL